MPATPSSGRFAQEQRQHLPARDAERAQHADLVAPRQHRDRDGVVDEEQADDQRDPRQRRQIQVERGEHPLDLLAAPRRPRGGEPGGQARADGRDRGVEVGARRRPRRVERGGARTICTSMRSMRPSRSKASCAAAMSISTKLPSITRAGPLSSSSAADDVGADAVAGHQPDLVAERVAAAARQLLGDDDALRAGEQLEELPAT